MPYENELDDYGEDPIPGSGAIRGSLDYGDDVVPSERSDHKSHGKLCPLCWQEGERVVIVNRARLCAMHRREVIKKTAEQMRSFRHRAGIRWHTDGGERYG